MTCNSQQNVFAIMLTYSIIRKVKMNPSWGTDLHDLRDQRPGSSVVHGKQEDRQQEEEG